MIQTRIAGIPCRIQVDTFHVTKGNYSMTAETPDDYYGVRDIEFTVFDRKGYPAQWLEDKMTDEDRYRVEEEIIKESKSHEDH